MTDKLPPNLLALFAPRPPLRYLPQHDFAAEERRTTNISGVGQYLQAFKEHEDEYQPTESWLQRRDRLRLERKEAVERNLTEGVKDYNPAEDPNVRGDAFKTLFVSRLSYDTESKDLEREFGRYGPIERIRIVTNSQADENAPKKKRLRGYAFIVFEREKDMKAAYKETDGTRIKDRRVLVDVERGRTVSGWRPRRFGGGLGGRGYTKAMPPRPIGFGGPPAGPGGGLRGGFRGGFAGRGGGGGFRGGRGDRGDRGGGFGGRGGIGYQSNGYAGAPEGAPAGPRGGRGGGYGGGFGSGGRSYGDGPNGHSGGGGRFDERDRAGGVSGGNLEPVRPRDRGYDRMGDRGGDRERGGDRGGYRDRDRNREGGYGDSYSRKREYDGGYDDSRKRRY